MAEVKATAFHWTGDNLLLLDQRRLPHEEIWVTCLTAEEVADAIREMVTRGAPLLGIAGAFGMVLAGKQALRQGLSLRETLERAAQILVASRLTAVNLGWAVGRLLAVANENADRTPDELVNLLEREAVRIYEDDHEACRLIGEFGAELLPQGVRCLTICNTGSLAVSGWGTALGVIKRAHRQGKVKIVYACETRPYLQGSRLTAWELLQEGVPFKLIVDGAAPYLMSRGMVDAIIVGADRIARNGDTANKIGTNMLALSAKHYGVPFYVAAPTSTIDLNLPDGRAIPIEERSEDEVLSWRDVRVAPKGAKAFNPSFDVTPSELVTAIVTEKGVLHPPYEQSIAEALGLTPAPYTSSGS